MTKVHYLLSSATAITQFNSMRIFLSEYYKSPWYSNIHSHLENILKYLCMCGDNLVDQKCKQTSIECLEYLIKITFFEALI